MGGCYISFTNSPKEWILDDGKRPTLKNISSILNSIKFKKLSLEQLIGGKMHFVVFPDKNTSYNSVLIIKLLNLEQ
jgi:hypothetical protein